MLSPTPNRFFGLARSSPWRWRTLRFVVTWRGARAASGTAVRGWVRRPDGLRVETLDGEVVHADLRPITWGASRVALTTDGRGDYVAPRAPLDPLARRPDINADGLVSRRPADDGSIFYGDPMFKNYSWVAMLDPIELADVRRRGSEPPSAPLEIDSLTEADHHGRPSWEAVVRPTAFYDPLCVCCALLFSAHILEAGGGLVNQAWLDPGFRFPDAHRVRLDVATGVCVLTEELGGSRPGSGHDMAVEAVDETMNDDLFVSAPRRRPRRPPRNPVI